MKGTDGGYNLSELFYGRGDSSDAVVNAATAEFRFAAVLKNGELVFDKPNKKIGVAGSHFSTHGYVINLFVVGDTEWKATER